MSVLIRAHRAFRHSPGAIVAAVVTLALGIAANTTVFTLLNGLALRPIPAPDPGRLVRVYPVDAHGQRKNLFSYPDYRALEDGASHFDALAAYVPLMLTVRAPGERELAEARELLGYAVSARYFELLGARPAFGRLIGPTDGPAADRRHPVAVVSHRLWRRLGAPPAESGVSLFVNGRAFTVIGVMPEGFVGTEPVAPDLWVPASMQAAIAPGPPLLSMPDAPWLLVIGRLRSGATRTQAAAELSSVVTGLTRGRPEAARLSGVTVRRATFFPVDRDPAGIAALMLFGSALVLLAAVANVTNLLLARALLRQRELAVRVALGASLRQIAFEACVEAAWIAVAAAGTALVITTWTLSWLSTVALSHLPFEWGAVVFDLTPDWRVLAVTSLAAGAAAVIACLAPVLQARHVDVVSALRGTPGGTGSGRLAFGPRGALVSAQVAVSLALLVAAALLARASARADLLDLGFSPQSVVVAGATAGRHGWSDARAAAFVRGLARHATALPTVEAVSFGSHVALTGGVRTTTVRPADGLPGRAIHSRYVVAGQGYFETLGIAVVRGRDLRSAEGGPHAGMPEAVVSEVLARRLWPGQEALGQRVRTALNDRDYTIVGVVRDTRASSLWRDKEEALYMSVQGDDDLAECRVLIRATGRELVSRELRALAHRLEPDAAFEIRSLEEAVELWRLPSRAAAVFSASIGVVALLLASLGVYAVLHHLLRRQTRDLAIRAALGADAARLVRFALRQAMPLVLPGLVVGTAAGYAIGRMLSGFLFGVGAGDPAAHASAVAVVGAVALAACWLPARRVAAVDPMVVLRRE